MKKENRKIFNEVMRQSFKLNLGRYSGMRSTFQSAIEDTIPYGSNIDPDVFLAKNIEKSLAYKKFITNIPHIIEQWYKDHTDEINKAKKKRLTKAVLINDICAKLKPKEIVEFRKAFNLPE